MEEKILEIINKYENIPADEYFVKEILRILNVEYNCFEYLKDVKVYRYITSDDKKRKFSALYYPAAKTIFLDLASFDNYNISQLEKNIGILILILHEFAHVTHEARDKSNKFQNVLLDISDRVTEEMAFGDWHDYIPDERLANIKSIMWCIDILSADFLKYQDQIFEKRKTLYKYLKAGYNFTNDTIESPLEIILNEMNLNKASEMITNYGTNNGFSLAQRLLYGLPINKDEYNSIQSTYNNLKTRRKLKIKIV